MNKQLYYFNHNKLYGGTTKMFDTQLPISNAYVVNKNMIYIETSDKKKYIVDKKGTIKYDISTIQGIFYIHSDLIIFNCYENTIWSQNLLDGSIIKLREIESNFTIHHIDYYENKIILVITKNSYDNVFFRCYELNHNTLTERYEFSMINNHEKLYFWKYKIHKNKLYITTKNKITICDFDGTNQKILNVSFSNYPTILQIFNNYAFVEDTRIYLVHFSQNDINVLVKFVKHDYVNIYDDGDIMAIDYDGVNCEFYILEPNEFIQCIIQSIPKDIFLKYTFDDKIIQLNYLNINDEKIFVHKCDKCGLNINIFSSLYKYKSDFFATKKISFQFKDISKSESDLAVDMGGLTRIVFYELSKYFSDESNKLFECDENTKLFKFYPHFETKNNIDHKTMNTYAFITSLYKYALVNGESISLNLDPMLLYIMLYGYDEFEKLEYDEFQAMIVESFPELMDTYPYSCFGDGISEKCKNIYRAQINDNQINYTSGLINNTYMSQKNIKSYGEVHFKKMKKHFVLNNKIYKLFFMHSIDPIIQGKIKYLFDVCKFKYTLKTLSMMISGINNEINLNTLYEHLQFENFSQANIDYLKNIFQLCVIGINESEWVKQLLIVMTGTNTISSFGYPDKNKLRITLNDFERNPIAIHTCFNQFVIKKSYFDASIVQEYSVSPLMELFHYDNLKKLANEISMA